MAQAIDDTIVNITKTAQEQIKLIVTLRKDPKLKLRIFTKPGGCSGLEYAMKLDYRSTDDIAIDYSDNVGVIIDQNTFALVKGITLDYENDLLSSGFKIDNPNAVKTCGCGTSFRTADEKGRMEKC